MLIVPIQQAHYLMGLDPLLMSFIVVIIGGLGSIRGSVIAALIIGLADGVIHTQASDTDAHQRDADKALSARLFG